MFFYVHHRTYILAYYFNLIFSTIIGIFLFIYFLFYHNIFDIFLLYYFIFNLILNILQGYNSMEYFSYNYTLCGILRNNKFRKISSIHARCTWVWVAVQPHNNVYLSFSDVLENVWNCDDAPVTAPLYRDRHSFLKKYTSRLILFLDFLRPDARAWYFSGIIMISVIIFCIEE